MELSLEEAHACLQQASAERAPSHAFPHPQVSSNIIHACHNLWQLKHPKNTGGGEFSVAIEQLFRSSLDLGLQDGEITPVQVWCIIRSAPGIERISAVTMSHLTEELCRHIKHERLVIQFRLLQIMCSNMFQINGHFRSICGSIDSKSAHVTVSL